MGKKHRERENDLIASDILAVGLCTFAVILLVGIVRPESGWLGRTLGDALRCIAGSGALAVPFAMGVSAWVLRAGARRSATRKQLVGTVLLFLAFVISCQVFRTSNMSELYKRYDTDPAFFYSELGKGGGIFGYGLALLFESVFGRLCSFIVLAAAFVVSLLLITRMSATTFVTMIFAGIRSLIQAQQKRSRRNRAKESLGRAEGDQKEPLKILDVLGFKARPETPESKIEEIRKGTVVIRNDRPQQTEPVVRPPRIVREGSDFQLPPVTLLKSTPPAPKRGQAELSYKIDKIEQTLDEFKIEADVVEVSHGPTVTRYEIQLAPGIKVSKIVSLADNLAMALAAIDVRVEAPIPGKSAIGVEVPNDHPELVTLRDVIDTNEFWNAPSKLTFALGKDVAGQPKFADLTRMPHMLIAGSTNSGKSICLNSVIASLLFRATPDEVKFVLIDPKRVELSLFDGIPHLCCPVVKDTRQAAGMLRTVLKEMDHRYDLFVKMNTRNIDGYNAKVKPEDKMHYLVVVVDELADLMMQAGPDVEFAICRLAQLARATGIHLVIATQRPSVDVVTGLIKANISSRIAFAVSSQIDSRTILDMGGAERLIGRGDMLFRPIDVNKPTRIQGCLVSEKEIEDLVKYLKEQESPQYTMEPSQIGEGAGGGKGSEDVMTDECYEPAVRLVVTSGYASTSMIQRRFKIGYTRAARLVDAMEACGIVGPLDGAKPREVLVSKMDLERIFGKTLFGSDSTEDFEEAAEE